MNWVNRLWPKITDNKTFTGLIIGFVVSGIVKQVDTGIYDKYFSLPLEKLVKWHPHDGYGWIYFLLCYLVYAGFVWAVRDIFKRNKERNKSLPKPWHVEEIAAVVPPLLAERADVKV